METVVVEILRPVVKILADHVTNKLRYLISCTKYVQKMREKIEVLSKKTGEVTEHIDKYNILDSETPEDVKDWLNAVEKAIDDAVKVIPSDNIGCFDIRRRYKVGKDASNAAKTVHDLINENPGTSWDRIRIPHGHVDPSISAPALLGGETKGDYDSRDKPFNEALKFLQQNDKTQVIALCGMGGVGKTTMMERLKKHAESKNMFNQIVKAVIGRDRDMFSVQKDIADYTGGSLIEEGVTARAESLRLRFEKMLKAKKKILVILDDVWETFELKNIGLVSPLPDGVKLLLTSRFEGICNQISAAILSTIKIVTVNVLEETEAMNFFCLITKVSEVVDRDLYKIGCSIVKECGYLPLAIKLIAATLKSKEKHVWRSTLERLHKDDLDKKVQEIIEISYNYLEEKEREIFLLCGLYPEDSNIPIEDLTRYAWGLNLFEGVSTLGDARDRTETCVSNLKSAYLLMGSDGGKSGCVKMHDLVLAFVVGTVYKREGKSIIHHGNRISLSCQGMSDFPSDLKFQNLSVLKLFYGNYSLKFPLDFYEKMKKLEVIGYKRMEYPLLPTSSQYSPNLRTLCLNECNLSLDYSCIGNLISLEVLSFAKSNIRKLPSTFQNLKKLRLLDLTDCSDLVIIDDGVLGNLGELEELYVGVCDSFTDCNYEELGKISENLYALEIEFQSQSPAMLLEKLERFKVSVGCSFEDLKDMVLECDEVSYENTLMLNTSKDRLLNSRMNKLFEKTEHLYLAIDGMEHLEDVDVHPPPSSSFHNLRFLVIKECGKLSYLFTFNVAISLSRLEHLEISECPVMESIIHIEGNGAQTITFPKLTCLDLDDLPELSCLCYNVNEIQLPRLLELRLSGLPKFTSFNPKNELATSSFLNNQVVVPMLEELTSDGVAASMLKTIYVLRCDSLVNLFPSNCTQLLSHLEELEVRYCASLKNLFNMDTEGCSMLRRIEVSECESLVNLFPSNRTPLLSHLEELEVNNCASLKNLFNMDTEVGSSVLRRIEVNECESLVNLFPSNCTQLLSHLEELEVRYCASLKNLFNMDTEGCIMLRRIEVSECESLVNLFPSNRTPLLSHLEELEVNNCASLKNLFNMDTEAGSSVLRRIEVSECESLVNLFPSNPMSLLHHLEELEVVLCASVETLFDIDMHRVFESEEGSSMLKRIHVSDLGKLREIWKVRGFNDDSITVIGGFQAVESICVYCCKSFENVFTPANANFDMRALMNVQIVDSGEWRRNSGLELNAMLKEEISSVGDDILNVAFPSYSMHNFHHLHNLILNDWKRVEVVFKIESGSSKELAKTQQQLLLSYLKDIHLEDMENMSHVWKCNWNEFLILQKQPFRSLTTITLSECNKIKYLFSPLMVKLLFNLKTIDINWCDCIEEVVSNMDDISDEEMPISSSSSTQRIPTLFPHLDSVSLKGLSNLKRIGGGGNGGRYETYSINTTTTTSIKVSQVGVVPWSLCQYSREIEISSCHALSSVIPSYALGKMQKLEVLKIQSCGSIIDVFQSERINNVANGGTSNNVAEGSSGTDPTLESPGLKNINVPQLLNLKEVHIVGCKFLQHVFTFSALESLEQLENLKISECNAMKVIVKEENGEETEKAVVFPRLKSIKLKELPNLEGFFLGMNNFLWESLELVVIRECPGIRLFTNGWSTALKLNFIDIDRRKHSLEQGLNFHVTTTKLDQLQTSRSRRLCPATSEGKPWSFHNIIEIDVTYQQDVKHIIPSNELLQLQKLEKIQVSNCYDVEEVFDVALEGTNSGFNESPTAVEIPNLREVELESLSNLKCIWKSNQSAALQFPNLTRLSIDECDSLKHVFTCSMAGSLSQLQELYLSSCDGLEVIVKEEEEEEECDGEVNEITLPCLKSLKLTRLSSLKGFCLGKMQAFSLPLLDTLEICQCPALTVFTKGNLTTPKLDAIKSEFGWVYVREDLNSVINTKQQEGFWNEDIEEM